MALISMTGGHLRMPAAPKLPTGGLSENRLGAPGRPKALKPPKPPKALKAAIKAPKVPTQPAGSGGGGGLPGASPTAGVGTGGANDPFTFIQGLLTSTDPAKAQALIDQVYAPLRQQVLDQIAQIDGMAKARADQMSTIYQEFAQYAGGLQGKIQQIFGGTGDAYGQGSQAGTALGMAGPQGAVGQHLAANAAINSNMESQVGQSWAAYAAAQPGIYSLYATQQIKQMLGAAQLSENQWREKLLSLSSDEASKVLAYLQNAQANDEKLQTWAFTQKQGQLAAQAKSSQAYLDYLQKQRQIDFNNYIVSQKLNVTAATARANANYKAALINLKQQGLITDAQYKQAQIGLGQQRLAVSQQNANTAASRANQATINANRNYALAEKKYQLAQAKYQQSRSSGTAKVTDKLAAAKTAMQKYAVALWAKQQTVSSTSTTVKKGLTVRTSQKTGTYTQKQLFNALYGAYAAELQMYYRQLNPTYSDVQIGGLVNRSIRAAVGYAIGGGG